MDTADCKPVIFNSSNRALAVFSRLLARTAYGTTTTPIRTAAMRAVSSDSDIVD
jgi:hypothetical protein